MIVVRFGHCCLCLHDVLTFGLVPITYNVGIQVIGCFSVSTNIIDGNDGVEEFDGLYEIKYVRSRNYTKIVPVYN